MAWRSVDNAISGASSIFQDAGNGLIRSIGGGGNYVGPSVFMIRTIVAGTTSAITMGLAGSGIAAAIIGTASIPFLVCACVGFTFGAVGFYRNALRRAMIALQRHPQLMHLHLDANYPDQEFQRIPRDKLRAAFSESWTMQSMLVCSWLTAQPALDNMLESQEQAIASGSEALVFAADLETKT